MLTIFLANNKEVEHLTVKEICLIKIKEVQDIVQEIQVGDIIVVIFNSIEGNISFILNDI